MTTTGIFTRPKSETTTARQEGSTIYTTELSTNSTQTSKPPGTACIAAQSTLLNQLLWVSNKWLNKRIKIKFSKITLYLSQTVCECVDRKNKRTWECGDTWTEDCFDKVCVNQKIELTPVSCPETGFLNCPRHQATKVLEGCCETWKCDCKFPKCSSSFSCL